MRRLFTGTPSTNLRTPPGFEARGDNFSYPASGTGITSTGINLRGLYSLTENIGSTPYYIEMDVLWNTAQNDGNYLRLMFTQPDITTGPVMYVSDVNVTLRKLVNTANSTSYTSVANTMTDGTHTLRFEITPATKALRALINGVEIATGVYTDTWTNLVPGFNMGAISSANQPVIQEVRSGPIDGVASFTLLKFSAQDTVRYNDPVHYIANNFGTRSPTISTPGNTFTNLADGIFQNSFVNAATVAMPGTRVLSVSDGTKTATKNVTFILPRGYISVTLSGTINTAAEYSCLGVFSITPAAGDIVIFPTAMGTSVNASGIMSTKNLAPMNIYLIRPTNADVGTAYTGLYTYDAGNYNQSIDNGPSSIALGGQGVFVLNDVAAVENVLVDGVPVASFNYAAPNLTITLPDLEAGRMVPDIGVVSLVINTGIRAIKSTITVAVPANKQSIKLTAISRTAGHLAALYPFENNDTIIYDTAAHLGVSTHSVSNASLLQTDATETTTYFWVRRNVDGGLRYLALVTPGGDGGGDPGGGDPGGGTVYIIEIDATSWYQQDTAPLFDGLSPLTER